MFRKILGIAVTLMLFAGVVSASSINGDYKGNPIVKVTSNGKLLETDEVPGMIYDGHTVVPISLLRQLGASVVWDGENYSVEVKIIGLQPATLPNQSAAKNDIAKLKAYSKAADFYRKLMIVGDAVSAVQDANGSVSTAITGRDPHAKDYIDLAEGAYKHANDMIVQSMNESNLVYDELIKIGVDISDVKPIIVSYSTTLKQHGNALDSIEKYYQYRNQSDSDSYFDNTKKAFESLKGPRVESSIRYFEYYNKVQNY